MLRATTLDPIKHQDLDQRYAYAILISDLKILEFSLAVFPSKVTNLTCVQNLNI